MEYEDRGTPTLRIPSCGSPSGNGEPLSAGLCTAPEPPAPPTPFFLAPGAPFPPFAAAALAPAPSPAAEAAAPPLAALFAPLPAVLLLLPAGCGAASCAARGSGGSTSGGCGSLSG